MPEPVQVKSGPHAGKWVEVVGTAPDGSPMGRFVPAPAAAPVDDGVISSAMSFLSDLGLSALERGGRRLGQMGVRASQIMAPPLRQIPGVRNFVATPEELEQALALLEPEQSVMSEPSVGEQAGSFLGELAPDVAMILGSGPAVTGARAAAGRGIRSALGPGRAATAAQTAASAGLEGGTAALEAMLAGGDPSLSAGIAGSLPVMGQAVRAVDPFGRLRRAAVVDVEQSLQPTRRMKERAETIAPEFVDRSARGEIPVRGNERLLDVAAGRADDAGAVLDDFQQQVLPGRNPLLTGSALKRIDDILEKETVAVNRITGQRSIGDPNFRRALLGVRKQIEDLGPVVDQVGILRLRQQLDAVARRAGRFDRTSVMETLRARASGEGGDALRRILNSANPDLAALNREFSFWKGIEDILTEGHRSRIGTQGGLLSAGIGGLLSGGLATQGADAGLGRGTRFFVGAAIGRRLVMALRSPLWQRVTSRTKNRLAQALFSEDAEAVELALGRIFAVEFPKVAGGDSEPTTSSRQETRQRELAQRRASEAIQSARVE